MLLLFQFFFHFYVVISRKLFGIMKNQLHIWNQLIIFNKTVKQNFKLNFLFLFSIIAKCHLKNYEWPWNLQSLFQRNRKEFWKSNCRFGISRKFNIKPLKKKKKKLQKILSLRSDVIKMKDGLKGTLQLIFGLFFTDIRQENEFKG